MWCLTSTTTVLHPLNCRRARFQPCGGWSSRLSLVSNDFEMISKRPMEPETSRYLVTPFKWSQTICKEPKLWFLVRVISHGLDTELRQRKSLACFSRADRVKRQDYKRSERGPSGMLEAIRRGLWASCFVKSVRRSVHRARKQSKLRRLKRKHSLAW